MIWRKKGGSQYLGPRARVLHEHAAAPGRADPRAARARLMCRLTRAAPLAVRIAAAGEGRGAAGMAVALPRSGYAGRQR